MPVFVSFEGEKSLEIEYRHDRACLSPFLTLPSPMPPSMHRIKILGIDPGLNTTNYGTIEISDREISLLQGGVIHTGSAEASLKRRLSDLCDDSIEEPGNSGRRRRRRTDHPVCLQKGGIYGIFCGTIINAF